MALILCGIDVPAIRPAQCGCTCARLPPSCGPRRRCGTRAFPRRRPCPPGRPRWSRARASDWARQRDRVDIFVGEQLAHVDVLFGLAPGLSDRGRGSFARGLIDVANRGDLRFFDGAPKANVRGAAIAEADQSQTDAVVGAHHPCSLRGGEGETRGVKEVASIDGHVRIPASTLAAPGARS